tara:strand:+ start:122 stop:751 length:630 start_codon:yes stop_codon:yes gene_type:complete
MQDLLKKIREKSVYLPLSGVGAVVCFFSFFTNSFEIILNNTKASPKISNLMDALAILPSRLENTNARDFSSNVQIFSDSLALINNKDLRTNYEKGIYQDAKRIERMVNALESAWKSRISDGTYYGSYSNSYYCNVLKSGVARFNRAAGSQIVRYNGYFKKQPGLLFSNVLSYETEECSPQEYQMVTVLKREINNVSNKPKSSFKLKTPW